MPGFPVLSRKPQIKKKQTHNGLLSRKLLLQNMFEQASFLCKGDFFAPPQNIPL